MKSIGPKPQKNQILNPEICHQKSLNPEKRPAHHPKPTKKITSKPRNLQRSYRRFPRNSPPPCFAFKNPFLTAKSCFAIFGLYLSKWTFIIGLGFLQQKGIFIIGLGFLRQKGIFIKGLGFSKCKRVFEIVKGILFGSASIKGSMSFF